MLLVLQAAGITFVIARGGIFRWLRRGPRAWRDFASCPLCAGFWVGFGLYLARAALALPAGWQRNPAVFLDAVGTGALVGAVALLFTSVIDWLDAGELAARAAIQTPKKQGDMP